MVGTVSPEAETGRKWRKVGGNHFVGVVGVLLRPQSATVMRYEGRKVVKRCVTSCFEHVKCVSYVDQCSSTTQ